MLEVYFRQETPDLGSVADEARRAEALGFDGYSSYDLNHDSFLSLAVAATATTRLKLETRAAIAFPRSPTAVAYTSWDLQQLSKGRFKLGLVTQSKVHVEQRYGTPFSPVTPRLRDYVTALRAVWGAWERGEPLDYRGEYYPITLMPPAFHPGRFDYGKPPIYLGAANPRNTRLAGEIADGFQIQTFNSAKYAAEIALPELDAGARQADRTRADLRVNCGGTVAFGRTADEVRAVREQARATVAFYASYSDVYRQVFAAHGWSEEHKGLQEAARDNSLDVVAKGVTDEMLDAFAVVGPYDEVGAMARERYEGLVEEVCFTLLRPALSVDEDGRLLGRLLTDLKG